LSAATALDISNAAAAAEIIDFIFSLPTSKNSEWLHHRSS
jgi:hypothetical protein